MITLQIISKKEIDRVDLRNMVWEGAADTVEDLSNEELDTIISILDDCYPHGLEDVELNDIFWFDREWIAEQLGFDSYEEILERRKEEEE
jgi:hypothetical protein